MTNAAKLDLIHADNLGGVVVEPNTRVVISTGFFNDEDVLMPGQKPWIATFLGYADPGVGPRRYMTFTDIRDSNGQPVDGQHTLSFKKIHISAAVIPDGGRRRRHTKRRRGRKTRSRRY
jgi:hypothetical protein